MHHVAGNGVVLFLQPWSTALIGISFCKRDGHSANKINLELHSCVKSLSKIDKYYSVEILPDFVIRNVQNFL